MRIFLRVLNGVPQARLVFVGEGPYEEPCRRMAERLGISHSVDFMGLSDRQEVVKLLRGASVFLSCSETEGLPNVLLEAQAMGLPVVASDILAHKEALAPELLPYLFRFDALDDAANSIKTILFDRELRHHLGRAGRQHVLDHYDGQSCLVTLENLYRLWTTAVRH